MTADIQTIKDTFKIGYETFEDSLKEANEIWDMYHNRMYTPGQEAILDNRGQPKETFNVIKMFSRMAIGYYSTVVNTVKAEPQQYADIPTASLITDIVAYTFRDNEFDSEGDKIKLDGLISGVMVSYIDIEPMEQKDKYGRPFHKIKINHVPSREVVRDPMSRKEDYSDARFLHRFKWMTEDAVIEKFGKEKADEITADENHLSIPEAEFASTYNDSFSGYYKVYDNYLIVHSIIKETGGKTYSCYSCGDVMLDKKEITYKEVKFPYRVQLLHSSDKAENYGIFREVKETQKAINQALLKIQLMVNTQKAIVEEDAVEDIDEFTAAFNRVNSVITVKDLQGVEIVQLSKEIQDQYLIIDKALDRIQQVLGINDSFLGMAYASDSGRKVKLQQNATILALRYITVRVAQFYRLLGWDIVNLIKQFYTAHQVLRITDETTGARWIEINKPIQLWNGQIGPDGQPQMQTPLQEVLDPATGEPKMTKEGQYAVEPIPDRDTQIAVSNVDIELVTSAYNDEDEKNQLMMETILGGSIGNLLAQVDPAGFFKASSLSIKSMKSKYSQDIAAILDQASMKLGGDPAAAEQASMMAGNMPGQGSPSARGSQTMKLPQNTNEGQ